MKTTITICVLLGAGMAGCNSSTALGEPPPAEQQSPPATTVAPRPAPSGEREGPGPATMPSAAARLTGSDVYRLNCQACHGPGGAGTAQGPALMEAARSLAAGGGDGPLRQRLRSGGERMPAFPHLTQPEVDALVAYLTEVGGGEVAEAPTVAALAGLALGERIYRSNCASCHASGRAGASGMMCRPASLAGATERFGKQQVMNLLDVGVGPMPAFGHLTTVERDALWAYLETLPAEPGAPPTMGRRAQWFGPPWTAGPSAG